MSRQAFTLLELATVVVVIAVLLVLLVPAISGVRARAQRGQCTANLHSLYLAANMYVQQNGSWPQVSADSDSHTGERAYALSWIDALLPLGPTRKTWICPAIQDLLHNPDYNSVENTRIDYIPMPFDDKPTTPHQWPRQPWFVEVGDVHGNGNLIVFTDGSISDLKSVAKNRSSGLAR